MHQKIKNFGKVAITVAMLAQPVVAADALNGINSALGGADSALGSIVGMFGKFGGSTGTGGESVGGVNEQDISKMTQVKNNAMLKQMISEAKPNMQSALSLLACSKTSDVYLSRAGKYATSQCNTVFGELGGLYGMNNNTSRCANIVRINNYKIEAKNSFGFSVTYESPSSGETTKRNYKMQRQDNGEWLFTQFSGW